MPLDFAWLGQSPAVDLANTFVPGQRADLLDRWLEARATELPVDDWRDLRAAVTETLSAATSGRQPPGGSIALLNSVSEQAPVRTTLESGGLVDREPLHGATARDALLIVARHRPIRTCAAPGCGMFFEAHGPRQQWCSNSCGNRARVARHYRRHSEGRSG